MGGDDAVAESLEAAHSHFDLAANVVVSYSLSERPAEVPGGAGFRFAQLRPSSSLSTAPVPADRDDCPGSTAGVIRPSTVTVLILSSSGIQTNR